MNPILTSFLLTNGNIYKVQTFGAIVVSYPPVPLGPNVRPDNNGIQTKPPKTKTPLEE